MLWVSISQSISNKTTVMLCRHRRLHCIWQGTKDYE